VQDRISKLKIVKDTAGDRRTGQGRVAAHISRH
jgi:hypothetical protein